VLSQRGVRYQLGGASPERGFDCSGLVQYVFYQHGIGLPRTAAEQYRTGIEIRPNEIALGDLLFFSTTGPGPTHVGIVTGPATFVHAPDTGAVVRQERFDTPYWSSRFLGARRQADLGSAD
jgi:cell wall-associated NlpC family hydrolase